MAVDRLDERIGEQPTSDQRIAELEERVSRLEGAILAGMALMSSTIEDAPT